MFDLLGAIPIHDRPVNPQSLPFKHLYDRAEINFVEHKVSVDQQRWWLLDQQEDTQLHQSDDLVVMLHGDCYPKLYGSRLTEKKKLSAGRIAQLYNKFGRELMLEVKGSFVLVVIDRRARELCVFTDPLNLRTAYYTVRDGQLLLSTSLTAVSNYLRQNNQPVQVDQRAQLDHYLFDFTLDDHTYLEEVREIPPGAILHFANGEITVTKYFDAFEHFDLRAPKLNRKDGAKQVKEVLLENIRLYNQGPDKTAIALTGGFDSRSIAALLGESISEYSFYSYGKQSSWDLKIPQLIADQLKLDYQAIYLDTKYPEVFPDYGKLTVLLSDGAAEFTHANIAYVYANYLRDKTGILTGLFGSELIKTPSSRGLFIDTHTIELLNAADPVQKMVDIFDRIDAAGITLPFYTEATKTATIEMIANHPFINNQLSLNEKYFHYLLMVGVRKYFRKETKIQRFWKSNWHPFFDLEFIDKLLETPFPWVYNFSQKKSLLKNIAIHKLYGSVIHENPALSNIMSTHGYRPRHLLHTLGLPMLAYEYLTQKKNISKSSGLNFQRDLAFNLIEDNRAYLFNDTPWEEQQLRRMQSEQPKEFLKMASLQYWLKSITK